MNIIQLEDNLKSLPDSNLENEMTNPSGMFPQYLVMSEIQRRKDMREDYAGRMAANEKTPPLPSMREEMLMGITQPQPPVQDSGIAGLLPAQPQGAPIPPAMSASPDVMPMYGGGVVGMSAGEQLPTFAEFLESYKEESEKEKEYKNLYEEIMAEQPERIREQQTFTDGLNLMRTGLAVGTAGTFKELSSGLEKAINSIDASNKSISEKKDKMKKLQLEKAKLDVDREQKIKDKEFEVIKAAGTADSMKDMYKSTAVKTAEYLRSEAGQDLKQNNLDLYNAVLDSLKKGSSAGSDWFTRLKTNRAAELIASYDEFGGSTLRVDTEIRKMYDDENLIVTEEMRDKFIKDRVDAQIQREIDILQSSIPELKLLEITEEKYSGGVVGQSMQNFNDIVKVLNA